MSKRIVSAALGAVILAALFVFAYAQTYPGQIPSNTILGNNTGGTLPFATPNTTLPNAFSAGTSLYPVISGSHFHYDPNASFLANTLGAKNLVVGVPATDPSVTWANSISTIDSAQNSTFGPTGINVVSPTGSNAFASATRSSDQATLTPTNIISNTCIAQHDNTTVAHLLWCHYSAIVATATAAASHQIGYENDVHNLGAAAPVQDPFNINPSKSIENVRLASGIPGNGSPNPGSSYLMITNNATTNNSGIIVANGSLNTGSNANPDALALANPYSITWYNAAAAKTWQIFAGSGANGNLNVTTAGTGAAAFTALNETTGQAYNATFTPVLTCGSGTVTTSTPTARYRQLGKTIFIQMNIAIATLGTCATTINASLPFTVGAMGSVAAGRDTNSGKMLQGSMSAGGTTMAIFNYDNTFPAASGSNFVLSGTFERN